MTECDNCGRATFDSKAVTFPNSDVVLCRRSECESIANKAKDLYYIHGVNDLRGDLDL